MPRGLSTGQRALWRCPKCGNYFASRNLWHSCVRVPLGAHFRGKDPRVRRTFDALVAALRRNGPLRVVSSKTRIAFMVRMRFAGVTPQKNALPGAFLPMRREPSGSQSAGLKPGATFVRTMRRKRKALQAGSKAGRTYGYRFRLTDPKQIDAGLRRLLAEAYQVGQQKHLERPRR